MRPGRRGWNRPQPLRTNRKNRHTASAAVPLALALILGGIAIGYGHKQLARTNRSDLIATTTGAVILPFQKGTAATQSGITGSFEALFRGGALQKENRKLSVRNGVLEAEVARLRDADAEAKRLRAEVDYIAAQKRPPAVCEVVGWLPSPIRQTITVANSPSSGIRKDAAVVDSVGRMIGHVAETEGLRAHVLLLIDPD